LPSESVDAFHWWVPSDRGRPIRDIWADIAKALQVLEVLADDSNFRSMAMELSAVPAAKMLTLPAEAFESAWCAGGAAA